MPRSLNTALLSLCGVALIGCTTTDAGPVKITKVNPYHLNDVSVQRTEDQMISFERARKLHGVVYTDERKEAYGNYFTIFWKSKTKNPATVRLEYRQAKTGPQIHLQELMVSDTRRSNVTEFRVTGNVYTKLGKVTQWKASVLENGVPVAEYKSFLWEE